MPEFVLQAVWTIEAPDLETAKAVEAEVWQQVSPDMGTPCWDNLPDGVTLKGLVTETGDRSEVMAQAHAERTALAERKADPSHDLCQCGHRRQAHHDGETSECRYAYGADQAVCPCLKFEAVTDG